MSKTRKPGDAEMPPKTVGIEGEPAESSYTVGYGKPPAHSRFKPGQSGNPKGKPKGRKSYRRIVAAVLNEKIAVNTPRGRKRMTKLEALIQTSMNHALKGDPKATDHILKIAREYGMGDEVAEAIDAAAMNALREEDRTILARHLGEMAPEAGE
jgi:hypothetical protein